MPLFLPAPLRSAPLAAALVLLSAVGLSAQQQPADPGAAPAAAASPAPPPQTPAPQTPAPQTPAGAAQAPVQPARDANGVYTVRRSARIVVLDVVVIDRKGNPVSGLTRDSFHVTEAGEPQTILNFEPAGAHTPSPDITVNSTAELDRLAPRAPVNLILLDEFNTRFEDMAFARYSLKKYLEKQPDKLSMPTMLLAVDLQHFTVLRDYTQSKTELISALDHHFAAFPWQQRNLSWTPDRFSTAFGTLLRVSEATVGHPGHKNMIWIGRGFPSVNLINYGVDAETRVNNAVQETVNALRDARVTLYTIDPAGVMVDPGEYGNEARLFDPFGGNYQFNNLARATGGRTLYGRNDVDAEIGTSIRDGGSFYTLTYRPSNDSLDPQKFRRIKITFDQPDLTAVTRQGYYVQRRPAQVNPQNPSRRLAFDLLSADSSTMVYDAVPLTLTSPPTDPGNFSIHVDPRALTWTAATDTEPHRFAEVVLLVSTFDKKGKELKRTAKDIRAVAPADASPTGRLTSALEIHYRIDPDPKAVRARFVVRVGSTGRMGTADTPLGGPVNTAASIPATPTP